MRRICLLVTVSSCALAASAMLECTGDASIGRDGRETELRGTIVLRFRSSLIRGWSVNEGLLLLHHGETATGRVQVAPFDAEFNEKAPPREVPNAKWIDAKVEAQPAGWSLIRVPGEALRALAEDERRALLVKLPRKWRVASRDSLRNVPYMFAEGSAPKR